MGEMARFVLRYACLTSVDESLVCNPEQHRYRAAGCSSLFEGLRGYELHIVLAVQIYPREGHERREKGQEKYRIDGIDHQKHPTGQMNLSVASVSRVT